MKFFSYCFILFPIIIKKKLTFCEYNIDCPLPNVCCKGLFFDYCCIPDKLVLAPIPVGGKK